MSMATVLTALAAIAGYVCLVQLIAVDAAPSSIAGLLHSLAQQGTQCMRCRGTDTEAACTTFMLSGCLAEAQTQKNRVH